MLFNRPQDLSPNHGGAIPPEKLKYIVMHATASEFPSAYSWLRNPHAGDKRVSANYIVDRPGNIYLLVPEGLIAWHAGVSKWEGVAFLNDDSVGIELVNLNTGRDPYPAAQYMASVQLVAGICRRHGIPAQRNRIVCHYDISPGRKTDPAGFPIDKFVRDVFITLHGSAPNPAPVAPEAQEYIVTPSAGLKVRTTPHTGKGSEVVKVLAKGSRVQVGAVLTKAEKSDCEEVIKGDSRWAWLADGSGFAYFRYLSKIGS